MSYIGVVFSFVFVNNAIVSRMLGLPESGGILARNSLIGTGLLFLVCLMSSYSGWILWILTRYADFAFLPSFCLFNLLMFYALDKAISGSRKKQANAFAVELRRLEASGIAFGIGALVARTQDDPLKAGIASVAAVCGYAAANVILGRIMDRLELSDVPRPFRGTPALLLNAGLVSMAFMAIDQFLLRNFPS